MGDVAKPKQKRAKRGQRPPNELGWLKDFTQSLKKKSTARSNEERFAQGRFGEQLAAEHLVRQGFEILERNMVLRAGEIDLIAQRDELLVFVEVRSRSRAGQVSPSESVTRAKQQNVVKAATEYCQKKKLFKRAIRFDVASVVGNTMRDAHLEYLENAFEAWF